MSLPRLENCCHVLSLKTGCLIIGILTAIIATLELFLLLMTVTLKPVPLTYNRIVLYVSYAVFNCLLIFFSVLVVVAVIKRIPILTLPWTILSGIQSLVYIIICSVALTTLLQVDETINWDLVIVVYFAIRTLFKIYFILTVHSYHKVMMQRISDEEQPELNSFLTMENRERDRRMLHQVLNNGNASRTKRTFNS